MTVSTQQRGFQAPKCANCNHAVGDHKSAGTHWPHPPSYGVCVRVGCTCTEFIPSSRKEPSHVQVQGDDDRTDPVRPDVAACVSGSPVVLEWPPLALTRVRALTTGLILGSALSALTVLLVFEVLHAL